MNREYRINKISEIEEKYLKDFDNESIKQDIEWLLSENRKLASICQKYKLNSDITINDLFSVWDKSIKETKITSFAESKDKNILTIERKDLEDWGRRLLRVSIEEVIKNK